MFIATAIKKQNKQTKSLTNRKVNQVDALSHYKSPNKICNDRKNKIKWKTEKKSLKRLKESLVLESKGQKANRDVRQNVPKISRPAYVGLMMEAFNDPLMV